jgi:hypothetical protein
MDYFEKGSPVRQHVTQEVHNDVSFLRKVQAKNLNAENFSTSTPVSEFRGVDVGSLFEAVMEAQFNVEDWKASFTITFPTPGSTINGVFQSNGDFSTEVSNWKGVGIIDNGSGDLISALGSESFRPTDGTVLNGIEISNSLIQYGLDNMQWTYKYEEDPTATGSDPMYLHDFTLNIDSTQINGYIVIGADDSVIAMNADGFIPSMEGGGGGPCDETLNFNIGLSSFDANSNLIGVDTFTGNDYFGALEIRSVEGSPVATSYAGPGQNLDFYMPVVDQSASDTYEYILTLTDDNTGCTYCGMAVNPTSITLVLNDPMQSEIAYNDFNGMGCGTMNPSPPAPANGDTSAAPK